ncbi:MAG: hypothetical protein ACTH6F_09450, partial [Halomonas sp.]
MKIRSMNSADLDEAASVHSLAFPRQTHSYEWLKCSLSAQAIQGVRFGPAHVTWQRAMLMLEPNGEDL